MSNKNIIKGLSRGGSQDDKRRELGLGARMQNPARQTSTPTCNPKP